jgi:hypothetical protein
MSVESMVVSLAITHIVDGATHSYEHKDAVRFFSVLWTTVLSRDVNSDTLQVSCRFSFLTARARLDLLCLIQIEAPLMQ